MKENRPVVCILGKLPPPYMGPAIATGILLKSGLKNNFQLIHVDTKINEELTEMGKWSLSKLSKNIGIYKRLLKACINNKPELVLIPISQSTIGFLKDSIYILICRILGRKVILHLRGSEFKKWMDRSGILTRLYVKWICGITSGVVVLGYNLRHLFDGFYPQERIFVAPNGADFNIPSRQQNDSGKLKILYIGNLQPSKGIEDLIEALKYLAPSDLDKVELEVIGGWRKQETKEHCLSFCSKFNLPVKFYPTEVSESKFQFLANADIFVFPPREPEGHPWVIVEAMAAGLPIISTDQGAIIESVKDGENGFIVSSSNPPEIAGKLSILINDPLKRQRMGQSSRKKYESDFTEARMVANLSAIFKQVIEK